MAFFYLKWILFLGLTYALYEDSLTETPLVSIIMTVHNRSRFLRRTISHVLD